MLDQITDPHNVGAITRSAAAFAVIGHRHHRAPQPGGDRRAGQAASGALELVPLVTVHNLARALTALNERGFLMVGLDSAGSGISRGRAPAPLALVLGAEGKGLRQLTLETCSVVARLDRARRDQEPQRVERRGACALCRRDAARADGLKHRRLRGCFRGN